MTSSAWLEAPPVESGVLAAPRPRNWKTKDRVQLQLFIAPGTYDVFPHPPASASTCSSIPAGPWSSLYDVVILGRAAKQESIRESIPELLLVKGCAGRTL